MHKLRWIWLTASLAIAAQAQTVGGRSVARGAAGGYLAPRSTEASAPAALSNLTIAPAASNGIVYTCDPTVTAVSATACTILNTTIAALYSSAFANANASIYVTLGSAGLGESEYAVDNVSYTAFRTALTAAESDPNDILAVTSSVPAASPYGTDQVQLTGALAHALGFTFNFGITPSGTICSLGPTNCYDGIITIANNVPLYFRNGSIGSNQYDFFTVVEHETDEILGTASCAFADGAAPCESNIIYPADLYRYHSNGTRSFAPGTNNACTASDSTNACFSLDGIHMLQQYNNQDESLDSGDWSYGCTKTLVQNAELCSGNGNVDISPTAEILVLDSIGYTLTSSATGAATSVTSTTANGTYGVGASVSIQIGFTETITVTGTPQLALNSGGTASYSAGSGTGTLTFVYLVAAGQSSVLLDYASASALTLNGGTIKGPGGTAVSLMLPAPGAAGSLSFSTALVINGLPSSVTLQTNPAGLLFSVDNGTAQTAPQTLSLSQGAHSIAVSQTQSPGAGSQAIFDSWSDGKAASHNITVGTSPATYTATYTVQYLLTAAANPSGSGSVTANPLSSNGYYNAGADVQLTAAPNAGFQFSNWAGGLSGTANPQSIAMNAAHSVTADFALLTCSLNVPPTAAALPATGTSTVETCPNQSGQPNCGVLPETPASFNVTASAACGTWTTTSSNPAFLQIVSGASGSGTGIVSYNLLNDTHNGQQTYTITIAASGASASYTVNQAGSGDTQVYREVYALYEQLLGRDPDAGGFGFWSGSGGAGLGQMADSFLTSPEAFNSDFAVMAVYQAATGAPPTFAQYTAAVANIRAGTQTVTSLFNLLINGTYSVANLYQNLLNRAPSGSEISSANRAGLAAWFEQLIGYPNSTTPVNSPNNEFQSTGTFHTTLAADHTNALYVQLIYYVSVGRDPDPSGFQFWLGIANQGGPGLLFEGAAGYSTRIQIVGPGTPNQGFIGSPEFQGLFSN